MALFFCISEVALFEIKLDMMRVRGHFTDLGDDVDSWAARMGELPPEVQGIYIRSHPIKERLKKVVRLPEAIRYVPDQHDRHYMMLNGTMDAYYKGLGHSTRRELRRQVSRFEAYCGGRLDVQEFKQPRQMADFYNLARRVSARSYQEQLLEGGFPNGPHVVSGMRQAAARDLVRGYVLFHGQRPVAYQYLQNRGGILTEPLYGYDQDYRKWGVGAVLQVCLLERWLKEGCYRMLDHGPGADYHQKIYSTGSVRCASVYFLRPRAANRLIVAMHRCTEAVSAGAGAALAAVGLKDKLKKAVWSKYCLALALAEALNGSCCTEVAML